MSKQNLHNSYEVGEIYKSTYFELYRRITKIEGNFICYDLFDLKFKFVTNYRISKNQWDQTGSIPYKTNDLEKLLYF